MTVFSYRDFTIRGCIRNSGTMYERLYCHCLFSVFPVDKLESCFAIHFSYANLRFASLPPLLTFSCASKFDDNYFSVITCSL